MVGRPVDSTPRRTDLWGSVWNARVINCAKHKRKSGIGLTAEQYGD